MAARHIRRTLIICLIGRIDPFRHVFARSRWLILLQDSLFRPAPSGMVLFIYMQGWWVISSQDWVYLFIAQCVTYVVLRQGLRHFGYSR